MEYRRLGKSDLKVSVLGLGTWEFGQTDAWGIGRVEDYRRIVNYALDAGVTLIDTAEAYGKSEEILGELLEDRRNEVVLATKIAGYDWSYETMRRRVERSMSRLRTDVIDLYQIHWPKIRNRHGLPRGMEPEDYEKIFTSIARLKEEDLIRAGGLSNFRLHHLKCFRDEAFDVIVSDQVPYSLLWRAYSTSDITEFCIRRQISYIAYSPLAQGLLTGKYSRNTPLAKIQRANILFNEPVYGRAMKVVDTVKEISREVGATPAQVALRWVMEQKPVASVLVGVRRLEELKEDIEAVELKLTRDQLERLDAVSREFWNPMPQNIELWIHDNSRDTLERIGICV